MPRRKNLKRLVRERMTKTGESYVTALAEVRRRAMLVPACFGRPPATPEEEKLERLLTALFDRLGCSLRPDPPVPGEWARPAFLIQPSAGASFYLDLGLASEKNAPRTAASWARLVPIDSLVWSGAGESLTSAPAREKVAALLHAMHPRLPIAAAISRITQQLVDPDLPYVVAVGVASSSSVDAGVIELWTGCGGPRLQVSAVLVVETADSRQPRARLYHHPEPRRPLTATPLLRLPQAIWARGRYLHGEGESLAALLGKSP